MSRRKGRENRSKRAADGRSGIIGRRTLLFGAGATAAGVLGYGAWRATRLRASVFVARGQSYDKSLVPTIRDGLLATGLSPQSVRGRRVLLKPNLVEPTCQSPQMTTHPAIVLAAADVFRTWGADVLVGEAPGHIRDTEMALVESGLDAALRSAGLTFTDLNYRDVVWVENRGHASSLDGFFFPHDVAEADLLVSMPKMKTHHLVGMTGAMKNMYGVLPGLQYGWPKNVLHYAGIPQTVFDINASLPKIVAVVDGIVGMEGDGPIMGTAKPMGLVLVGANSTAVDATAARIMGLEPYRIPYLHLAGGRLGPLREQDIDQRGEPWQALVDPFLLADAPQLRAMRAR